MCRLGILSTSPHTHKTFVYHTKYCWQLITHYKAVNTHLFFPYVFVFCFRRLLYSILRYFSFFLIQFFVALGDCPVCLPVKAAVNCISAFRFCQQAVPKLRGSVPRNTPVFLSVFVTWRRIRGTACLMRHQEDYRAGDSFIPIFVFVKVDK
jgi:hypothetical protein